MNERRRIHAGQKGRKEYFQEIAEEYYDDIWRFCAFQTGSGEDAHDLTQETFLRFIRYAEGYRERNLKGYLLTIAMNLCRDYRRKTGRESALTVSLDDPGLFAAGGYSGTGESGKSGGNRRAAGYGAAGGHLRLSAAWEIGAGEARQNETSPEGEAMRRDILKRLTEALRQLPEMQREAMLLYFLHDMKYREIGKATGVSVSTVKSRVRQGTEKLRDILRKEDYLD